MKKALITGITGQDGSYLTEYLLHLGYEIHGLLRRSSSFNTGRIEHLLRDKHEQKRKLHLHYGDLTDTSGLIKLILEIEPTEIYHLGAQSHVRISFDMPEFTGDVTGLGSTRLLEALRISKIDAKYYQASSSELFGSSPAPQNENTPFQPQSPYACAKLYAYWMANNYRKGYGLKTYNGILFNHESPRRGRNFVTRKITYGLSQIISGKQDKLYLGNLNAKRDWGFAPEYVQIMHKILQQDNIHNVVMGTGITASIRDFLDECFKALKTEIEYVGEGLNEKGVIVSSKWKQLKKGQSIIEIDPIYYRPTEVNKLLADNSKMKTILGYSPKFDYKDVANIMMESDLLGHGKGYDKLIKHDYAQIYNFY